MEEYWDLLLLSKPKNGYAKLTHIAVDPCVLVCG